MATHQPPATPNTLVTLPDDLLLSILGRVPCKDDRASMSLICKAWHAMVARLSTRAARPPLPWLLLPSRFRIDPAFRAACVLSAAASTPTTTTSASSRSHPGRASSAPTTAPGSSSTTAARCARTGSSTSAEANPSPSRPCSCAGTTCISTACSSSPPRSRRHRTTPTASAPPSS
uniref:Putative F-box domain, cyclin n=1 Tax=Saccharum hybrid cultivar R570 TaxID=131158 RepID=A0A059Q330_9POAL|nr:putative F-box domain, cyclin [Saccharum hybrid cultivar R570]